MTKKTSFAKTKKQAKKLVEEYLKLQKQKYALEDRLDELREEIALFSKQSKMKTLKSDTHLLYVTRKKKVKLPKKDEPGRKQVEYLVKQSKQDVKHAIKFDIVKLAYAYEKKKLSEELIKKLKPFVKKTEFIKMSAREIKDED